MKIIWFIGIFFLIIFSNVSISDRLDYYFSDDVFQNLPSFPDDFFEIKNLLSTQQIYPSQLNSSYYTQPEILPNWYYFAEKYYNKTNDNIGQYGLGIYPSRFDIYDAENITVHLSSIVFCSPGINKYQGIGFRIVCDDKTVNISLSSYNLLLEPTYPIFYSNWSKILDISITIKQKNNTVIKIFEQQPNNTLNNLWKQQFGKDYVTGASILSLQTPKLQIFLHDTTVKNNEETVGYNMSFSSIVLVVIIFCIVIGGAYAISKKLAKKIQE